MFRRALLLTAAALSLHAAPALAQTLAPVPLATIDPTIDDLSDLDALGRDVGDARIVVLGEQTHGDGATLQAKARVIRYLHERMGFDVLVFEGGLTGLAEAQRQVEAGALPSAVLPQALLPVWTRADQFGFTAAYLDRAQAAGDPLILAGMDLQDMMPTARVLPGRWRALAPRLPADAGAALLRIADLTVKLQARDRQALADLDLPAFEADVALAHATLLALPDPAEASREGQALESWGGFVVFFKRIGEESAEVFNLRDAQMADNLIWLAETAYPGRRIIVWAATSHGLRDRGAIDPTIDGAADMVPVGRLAAEHFGDDLYVLAFTSGGGAVGSWQGRQGTDVGTPPADSLEGELLDTGLDYAFTPLKPSPSGERRLSWMLGFQPMPAWWDRAVDGLIFIREQTPTTYPEGATAP